MKRAILMVTIPLILVALTLSARAEFWVETTSELFSHAKTIEVIRISKVSSAGLEGVVVEGVRGRARGTKVKLDVGMLQSLPPVGAKALVICDSWVCPRAIGRDHGGYFVLEAQQPMDGAQLLPGLIEHSSLKTLVSGKGKAPSLKVRAKVRLIDEPSKVVTIDGSFSAEDGEGFATSALTGSSRIKATLLLGDGLIAASPSAVSMKLFISGNDSVTVSGGPIRRLRNGWYEYDAVPSRPLARSRAQFAKVLKGGAPSAVLAKGYIQDKRASAKRGGKHPVTLEVDDDGRILFKSALFQSGRINLIEKELHRTRVGIGFSDSSTHPHLLLDLGRVSAPLLDAGVGAVLADRLKKSGTIRVDTYYRDSNTSPYHAPPKTGQLVLTHSPD